MAPWPTQNEPHPPPPPPGSRHRHTGSNATPYDLRDITRMNDLSLLDSSQVQADSSSSESDLHPNQPRNRPRHGRSLSHPFPSLFSAKKKRHDMPAEDDSDSDFVETTSPMSKLKGKAQANVPRSGHASGNPKDFATGSCMTCGSLIRWPKNLDVFKCTICLTINDLQPIGNAARPGDAREVRGADRPLAPEASSARVPHISLDHTRLLVRQCLESFISAALSVSSVPETDPSSKHSRSGSSGVGPGFGNSSSITSDADVRTPSWTNGPAPAIHVSTFPSAGPREPTLHPNPLRSSSAIPKSYSTSFPERGPVLNGLYPDQGDKRRPSGHGTCNVEPKRIFKPLEDYIVNCFSSFECINTSFLTRGITPGQRSTIGTSRRRRISEPRKEPQSNGLELTEPPLPDLDPKLLLLGDVAENGAWWTGGRQEAAGPVRSASYRNDDPTSLVTHRNPRIDWTDLDTWYSTVINPGQSWLDVYQELADGQVFAIPSERGLQQVECQILTAQEHTQRVLLKASEVLLKRPGRPIREAEDLRFLLITLANPLLHASWTPFAGHFDHPDLGTIFPRQDQASSRGSGPVSGKHSVVIKRVLGLISNAPLECHNHLTAWFSRYSLSRFLQTKDLVGGFLAYRLIRQNEKKQKPDVDVTDHLIPNMLNGRSPASLHAALGPVSGSAKKPKEIPQKMFYNDDWQIKAAARVMSLLFAANNSEHNRRAAASQDESVSIAQKDRLHAHGQFVPTSDFYASLLDDSDLLADFDAWESRRGKFSFCQYPFLLSIWAKIKILEYDARRQMQNKARDAFFDSIMTRRNINQFLVLDVRRDCLVEDSLKAVSEVIGGSNEDIKKGLRIVFKGEEGVDAGGLRKEWFLLLVREVFNPDHGLFIYDEDSQYCYFNPHAFETSDQFFLVGVVFGLAIYNSTILDVAFPPFAFRKLLTAAPAPAGNLSTQPRPSMTYTLDDLAEYRPRLAKGLRQLLDFDGDVETTFCLDFVVEVDKYGAKNQIPLCSGGERRPVTNTNRKEYVDLYVRYLLDAAVARQFEPFKRGFFTVCGGNALSLFRPEEIELLVRGSDEPLDIKSLRLAASYDNWGSKNPAESEETVQWFWQSFEQASPKEQRRMLLFITGSDRIPAMGAASLTIRITCLGEDSGRYPTARTCFNMLALWRYKSRDRLEGMLWRAVYDSEGFGLK